MKSIFQRVADEVKKRREVLEAIRLERSLINGNKMAATIDLDRCFYDAAMGPRGKIGIFHALSVKSVALEMMFASCDGMPMGILPMNLAKTTTQENMDKWFETHPGYVMTQPAKGVICLTPVEKPEYFSAIYVDDYLSVLERHALSDTKLKLTAVFGDGNNTLGILRDLRKVPDYSEHFPPRPPKGGKEAEEPLEERGFAAPVFVPGGV